MSENQVVKLNNITALGLTLKVDAGDVLIGPLLMHELARGGDPSEEDIPQVLALKERVIVDVSMDMRLEMVTWDGRRVWATTFAALETARAEKPAESEPQ